MVNSEAINLSATGEFPEIENRSNAIYVNTVRTARIVTIFCSIDFLLLSLLFSNERIELSTDAQWRTLIFHIRSLFPIGMKSFNIFGFSSRRFYLLIWNTITRPMKGNYQRKILIHFQRRPNTASQSFLLTGFWLPKSVFFQMFELDFHLKTFPEFLASSMNKPLISSCGSTSEIINTKHVILHGSIT